MAFRLNQSAAQQIVETVKSVCGKDVNYIQPDGKIAASTDASRIGDFHEIGFESARTLKTIEVRESEKYHGTQPGVNMPFLWKGELTAVIGVTGDPDEVRTYAALARRIASLLLREHELDLADQSRRNRAGYVVNALVSGQHLEREFLDGFLAKHHLSDRSLLRAIVLVPAGDMNGDILPEQESGELFAAAGTDLSSFRYPREYVILCESRRTEPLLRRLSSWIHPEQGTFLAGIGSAETVFQADRSYRTASLALQSLRGHAGTAFWESLDMELLLSSAPMKVQKLLREKTAVKLDPADIRCLDAYFSCNLSVKAASEKLFIHKNTLQYHLDRVYRLTGYNPRRFRDAMVLWTGLSLPES